MLADAQAAAYSVTISRRDAMWPLAQSDVEEVIPGLFVQANNLLYSNQLGLIINGPLPPDMDILKYGADVEVIAPDALKEAVKIQLDRIRVQYG